MSTIPIDFSKANSNPFRPREGEKILDKGNALCPSARTNHLPGRPVGGVPIRHRPQMGVPPQNTVQWGSANTDVRTNMHKQGRVQIEDDGLVHKLNVLTLKPDDLPNETSDHVMEAPRQFNLTKICPEGSIPIERTQRNDQFGGNHVYKSPPYFLQQAPILGIDGYVHEYATIVDTGAYYGAKATMSLWNPKVETPHEFSLSQMWLISADKKTTLEAGWMVYPQLYGDSQTRFFIFWTFNFNLQADGYRTGCYNLHCPGFVQTNNRFPLNGVLRPISVYGGDQFDITIQIFKGRKTRNWWLYLQGIPMGYWPNELVEGLARGARLATFGGEVAYKRSTQRRVTSTQMGSGHFASEGFRKSSFFRNVMVVNTSNWYGIPGHTKDDVTSSACYDVRAALVRSTAWGYFFYYGGPGRSDKCS
ncbi:hypothetical protein Taro_042432 [Colocasia esculenta]|uniref:Neprosin PEP catalytic domain-containing protein n=1 Tax=Colocasia esculenta TaxID=4460 RepID=A0A843WIG5_COLES|nr:hypothetical protein [Colocasia esculenta]